MEAREVTYTLTPSEHARIDQAMMLCKRQSVDKRTVTDGQLLERICSDWLGARGVFCTQPQTQGDES